jgi:hypothetical protein
MRRNLLLVSFFSLCVVVFFVERLPRPTTALNSAMRENAFIGYSEKKQISCVDSIQMCADWAKNGECAKNPGYMSENCCCGAFFLCVCFFHLSLFALSGRVFFCSLFVCFCHIWTTARVDSPMIPLPFKLSLVKQRATRSVPCRPTTRRRKK